MRPRGWRDGETIISSVRGEGLTPRKTFLGLDLTQAGVVLFLVRKPGPDSWSHCGRGAWNARAARRRLSR